jgi:Regulator of ribonuclease activity B
MMRLFATVVLALSGVGTAIAAGGTYDQEDPFRERQRIAHFKQLGGDVSQEVDIEIRFDFKDRPETREHYATIFAAKLRQLGYPEASARPCGRAELCWVVTAPKRMRIDEKKMIALSKELDQLAADDYGRYNGWDCEQFRKEDERILAASESFMAAATAGNLLEAFAQFATAQCDGTRAKMERDAEQASAAGKVREAYQIRRMIDLQCTCMPERARQMRADLKPEVRDAPITDAEFTQHYAPDIAYHCAAKMARRMYGDDCAQLPVAEKASDSYCPCMKGLVYSMSDADVAQVGLQSADWIPRAAEAKKAGQGEPEKPPLLKQFMEKEVACRK